MLSFKLWCEQENDPRMDKSAINTAREYNKQINLPKDWNREELNIIAFGSRTARPGVTDTIVDPDTIHGTWPIITFYYSNRKMPDGSSEGLVVGRGDDTHNDLNNNSTWLDRKERIIFMNASVKGRYGYIEDKVKAPVMGIWKTSLEEEFNQCLQALWAENLVHPRTLVYMGMECKGEFKDLIKTKADVTQKGPDPIVNIGSQSVHLSQIPGMLHVVPKASPLYQQISDFICKYKDHPEYSRVLQYISHRVSCYNKKRDFTTYHQLRQMLHPDNIDKEFSTQRDIDAAFDKLQGDK